jgi:hypothetical protein
MPRHEDIVAEESSDSAPAERGCACIQRGGEDHSSAPATSCACSTVDEVVKRSRRTGAIDVAKVAAFVALLVAVVLALWR